MLKYFGLLIDKQCNLDSWATTHLACANEKTTNFYFFLLSPRFLLQSYARMFQVEQFHIGGVVTSGFIASKLFFCSWPTLENTFTFSLFLYLSMNKLNRSETKNWNFSLIFLITICQFRNWFQSFINTIFLQEKSSRWSSFWPFCLLF